MLQINIEHFFYPLKLLDDTTLRCYSNKFDVKLFSMNRLNFRFESLKSFCIDFVFGVSTDKNNANISTMTCGLSVLFLLNFELNVEIILMCDNSFIKRYI